MKPPILGTRQLKSSAENMTTLAQARSFTDGPTVQINSSEAEPLYTGRQLVVFNSQAQSLNISKRLLQSQMGYTVASSSDFKASEITEDKIAGADAFVLDEIGVALIDGEMEQVAKIRNDEQILIVEPEKVVYVPEDVVAAVVQASTWGITATNVLNSTFSGRGIRVAVLDTGMDLNHPDFAGRTIVHSSFVPNEPVQDLHGHGTHCIGSACGNTDQQGTRYGVARNAEIYAGKVLSNAGSGAQLWILNGMTWAVSQGCKVISMSLGSPVWPGMGFDLAYERAAQFAVSNGCIVVAAAGNESKRNLGVINPVGSPANCPSVLAVGAMDSQMQMGNFSNRAINAGQLVDIAAPGVGIYSSWPMSMRYNTISGTSMATPHVAGILALLWEQNPGFSPAQIIQQMHNLAMTLNHLSQDVGSGLTQAP